MRSSSPAWITTANIAPWLLVARDRGCVVRWLDFDRARFEFDPATLEALLERSHPGGGPQLCEQCDRDHQ